MQYIGAIDQGTTSTRFLIFDQQGKLVTSHQVEFEQSCQKPGWIEHDPYDLLDSAIKCADEAMRKFEWMGNDPRDVKAIGIANQRETTLVWDNRTGEPLHNAIVWGDTRTNKLVKRFAKKPDAEIIQRLCGLPLHNYFSALKIRWLMDNVEKVKTAFDKEKAMFGTVDSWLVWNLTGGVQSGVHVTDVTNASRTMLMNIETRQWDPQLLDFFDIPASILPRIVSSSEVYGKVKWGPLEGLPISGCLGDQQAALVGQKCFSVGEVKNTYGTGAFLLFNVGHKPVFSTHGLLSTVAYQFGPDKSPVYALEGSVSVAGGAVRWLKDNMGIIEESSDINVLASKVEDTGGVQFIPAFSGLFAPYWRDDARGVLVGLTQYTNKYHLSRAVLEAACFSTRAILDAMKNDGNLPLKVLKADGGMSNSDVCMQIQADVLGITVERPAMNETTALGAAYAAGLAIGVWKDTDAIQKLTVDTKDTFQPKWKTDGKMTILFCF
ncbi:hypothetical protein F4703DRAFT_1893516 [Phycomyces blakesleeanus]